MTAKKNSVAHWARRLIHVCMILIPFAYHAWAVMFARFVGLSVSTLMICLAALLVLIESIRLKQGGLFFGQRSYERHQISAVAWGGLSVLLICFFAPGLSLSFPLIGTCALVDPLMGEMRRQRRGASSVAAWGLLLAYAIWLASWWCFGTSLLFVLVCPALAVLAEYPRLRWIDDNALMMLVPLSFVMLV